MIMAACGRASSNLDLERPPDRLDPEKLASTTRAVAANGGYTDSAFYRPGRIAREAR
jgi:hypothetical protein